jgi:tetratricopeptide (TPR) repeat protein
MFLTFFFGAFGAIVAELLKRWQQWNEMPEKRFFALFKSIEFWSITLFLILLGGGVGAFEGKKMHPIDYSLCFFVGVGAVSIVRNFLSGMAAQGGPRAKRRRLTRQLNRRRVDEGGLIGKGRSTSLEREGETRYVHQAALETVRRRQEPVLEETERVLQKAVRLYPQNAEAHYILGVLLKEVGRLEEAGRAFQEAIHLNLQNAEAHYNLGVSLKERGQFTEAERAFQEAIRLNPQNAPVPNSGAGSLREPLGLEKPSSLDEKADTNLRTPIGWRDIFN